MENKHLYKIDANLRKDFPYLFNKLERLKGITGFISILGNDPHIKVFCRYNHVQRVVRLTGWLITLFPERNSYKSLFLAYFHDINRLPFAHNLEEKIEFNQSENLRSYLQSCKDNIPDDYVLDLESVISRKVQSSPEAQLVYAADAAEGFIEDTLFAITTLGISTDCLPHQIASRLGFNVNEIDFKNDLLYLNKLFIENPDNYSIIFGDVVFKHASEFIKKFNGNKPLFIETPEFPELRNMIKENFLKKIIFPINNEKISQGKRIVTEIAIPYIEYLKREKVDPFEKLLKMTDQEVLDHAVQLGLTSSVPQEYWPKLL